VIASTPDAPRRWLIERPGRVRATSRSDDARGGASVEEVLGVDWPTLETLAQTTRVLDAELGRIRLEPLIGRDGALDAVLASKEETPGVASTMSTLPPPSSSRWGRDLTALVGKDIGTRAAVDLALRFARTTLPVLISAEEGSGADVLARAMASAGGARAPFVHVRVGVFSPSLVETAIWSAGATATNGTLFVEDVHELSAPTGRRFAKEIDRGALSHVRIVCSATPDLAERVGRGESARELLALVRGSTVTLPPLREREDFRQVVARMLEDLGAHANSVTPAAMEALEAHDWPRNQAELWSCLEHAMVVAGQGKPILREHLPQGIFSRSSSSPQGLRRTSERAAVEEALRASGGNVSAAARRLGVARSTLYRLMGRYGLVR
jgi:transcriptional regulator of acetoin/glycerol metabolism